MDTMRFDRIARLFATRHTRRAAIGNGIGLAAAASLAPHLGHVSAQEATPTSAGAGVAEIMSSTAPHPGADKPAEPTYLFVQPFAGGTWAPKADEEGTFTLTLTGASAQTVYFSDRPERIFGVMPTQDFLDNLGFTPANPPNAALVANTEGGDEQDILVIELLNPVYDEAAGTLTYDAKVLADYSGEVLAHAARLQTDYSLPASFTEGGLFIDGGFDCPDTCATCYIVVNGEERQVGLITNVGQCNQKPFPQRKCRPCEDDNSSWYYGKLCAEKFPNACFYRATEDRMGTEWNCYAANIGSCQ